MSNWRCIGAWILNGFPNKHSFLTRKTWAAKKNLIGPSQTRVTGWQSKGNESGTDSQWGLEPPVCHSPPLLSLHKKGVITPWLAGREMPQAASTPQSGVSPSTPAVSLEGFGRISPKQRKIASLKQTMGLLQTCNNSNVCNTGYIFCSGEQCKNSPLQVKDLHQQRY